MLSSIQMSLLLRLIVYFAHLYPGNCDGCLNFGNEANGGLESIWEGMNDLYDREIPLDGVKPLSRADLFFLAGTVAVEVTVDYNNQICAEGTDPECVPMEMVSQLALWD